jgi:hypothetical protein
LSVSFWFNLYLSVSFWYNLYLSVSFWFNLYLSVATDSFGICQFHFDSICICQFHFDSICICQFHLIQSVSPDINLKSNSQNILKLLLSYLVFKKCGKFQKEKNHKSRHLLCVLAKLENCKWHLKMKL